MLENKAFFSMSGAAMRDVRVLSGGWMGALALSSACAPARQPLAETETRPVAFVGVTVLPMTGAATLLPNHTVIVRGTTIAAVGPRAAVRVPDNAVIIDGRDRFLMPGLVDAHVHVHRESDLLLYLASGVTTVRNMKGEPKHLLWREEVLAGLRLGPTIHTTSPFIEGVVDPVEAERLVRTYQDSGYEFIKIHGDLSRSAYDRLSQVARERNIPVVGHIPRNLPFAATLENRQSSIDHAEEYVYTYFGNSVRDTTRIAEVAQLTHAAGIAVTPTLVAYEHIGRQLDSLDALLAQPEARFLPPMERVRWLKENNFYSRNIPRSAVPSLKRSLAFQQQLVGALQGAGVRLMLGTDAGGPETVIPGTSALRELELLVAAGLTPHEALSAATSNPGVVWPGRERFGAVVPGMRADLLLLDANPLDDIRNVRRLSGVMVRGRRVPQQDLQSSLERIAMEYQHEVDAVQRLEGQGLEAMVRFRNSPAFSRWSNTARRYLDYRIPEVFAGILADGDSGKLTAVYDSLKQAFPHALLFTMQDMKDMGYRYLWPKKTAEAIAILSVNAREYPTDAAAFSALGEAFAIGADTVRAVASFQRALELDGSDPFARSMLAKLRPR
jgi:hypothetical protein